MRRPRTFHCLIPVLLPGGWACLVTEQAYVPAGEVVYLEMHRLLFGEAGDVVAYCCVARTAAVVIAKVLGLPAGHYIDDFWLIDRSLPDDLGKFVKEILGFELHNDKFAHGMQLLFLSMQLLLSPEGVSFCRSDYWRQKYVELLQQYLTDGRQGCFPQAQAAKIVGRLSWSCNALFGRSGRPLLAPILRRAMSPEAWPQLKRALRRALQWWCRWLQAPARDLTRLVPATPRRPSLPAISYTNASTDFGLGVVLFLPVEGIALFFRTRLDAGEPTRQQPA